MAANHELIQAINHLSEEQQSQVLEFVRTLKSSTVDFDFESWWKRVDSFQAEFRAAHGENYLVNSQDVLDEIREERLNDIMGGG